MTDVPKKVSHRNHWQVGLKVALLTISILVISSAHYYTPTQLHLYHDVFRRLYYLPIFVAALWFGLKGGLGASMMSSILYAPHILFQWKIVPTMGLERYLEILLFNIVGAITGLLAQSLNRQRNLYRNTSEELEQAYEELERRSSRLSDVERELRQAEKLSALGELSATVAHELMNPLGSIKGAVEILKDDYPRDHEKYTFLEILIREIDRLDRTIRSVLRFSSRERIRRKTCHPNEIIETILTLTRIEAGQRGIIVSTRLSGVVRPMELDPDKINQALLNLTINAIQAMPDGGSLKVISEWMGDIPDGMEIETRVEGCLLVSLEDSGKGILNENIKQVFEPFYTTKEEGTGLGLSIVKKIIEAHNGRIQVDSAPDSGTKVTVWLPNVIPPGSQL